MTVFRTVIDARDAALAACVEAWSSKSAIQGWQVDDAARDVLERMGFKDGIRHRTGHSLSGGTKVHGIGVNIDGLETRDTRTLIPGVGFTIEPGLYFADFGVRSEINVYMDPMRGPVVTSSMQRQNEPVWMA
jgi:Xaa-Pro aminopeptidase